MDDSHQHYLRLLSATAQGDRTAFSELYHDTAGKLYAVSLQMLHRRDWAEDAVQEAYVRIWHNAGEYQQEKGTVLTWMISIVRYRALDMLRATKSRRETGDEGLEEALGGVAIPAERAGNAVFLSGQIPLDPATGQLVEGDIAAQAQAITCWASTSSPPGRNVSPSRLPSSTASFAAMASRNSNRFPGTRIAREGVSSL